MSRGLLCNTHTVLGHFSLRKLSYHFPNLRVGVEPKFALSTQYPHTCSMYIPRQNMGVPENSFQGF